MVKIIMPSQQELCLFLEIRKAFFPHETLAFAIKNLRKYIKTSQGNRNNLVIKNNAKIYINTPNPEQETDKE